MRPFIEFTPEQIKQLEAANERFRQQITATITAYVEAVRPALQRIAEAVAEIERKQR